MRRFAQRVLIGQDVSIGMCVDLVSDVAWSSITVYQFGIGMRLNLERNETRWCLLP
jgi:hypothetical protein